MKRVLVNPTAVIRWSWKLPSGTPTLTYCWVPTRGIQPITLQKLASLAVSPVSEPQFIWSYTVIYSVI